MINLTTVISIRLNLGTINSGMSYEITYADGHTETQPHTPALQAFLGSQGWIARRDRQHETLVQAANKGFKRSQIIKASD